MKLALEDSSYRSSAIEMSRSATDPTQPAVKVPLFRLCKDVAIYMFSTVAPCGDASMDLLISSSADPTPWSAESLASDRSVGQPLGRGYFSLLGAVRRKPARADAEATMSKSCTDKMALKQFTGLLSFPVDLLIGFSGEACLKGLVVYDDQYDGVGFERAFGRSGRLGVFTDTDTTQQLFFDVMVLPPSCPRFQFEKVKGDVKCKVTNIAAVFVAGSNGTPAVQEVLVNGVKQGYKQLEDRPGKGSVLCRKKMVELAQEICALLKERGLYVPGFEGGSYSELKGSMARTRRREAKQLVIGKLGGWMSNSGQDDFNV